jgi:co-chaperonin GroES (HSP10)
VEVKPTRGRLQVQADRRTELSERGLIVPQTVTGGLPSQQGRVVGVGDGAEEFSEGDWIVWAKFAEVTVGNLSFIRKENVVCRL